MKEFLKRWWQGTYVPAPPNDPYSGVIFMSLGTYELHWTAKVAHMIADFWMKHWQWCFSAAFATIGLFIAALKL
jgi:hypothetical protein